VGGADIDTVAVGVFSEDDADDGVAEGGEVSF